MAMDQPVTAAEKLGDELRMSFGEHIEELRQRLIHSLVGVGVAAAVAFYFGWHILSWLAQPFLQALNALDVPAQLYVRDPMLGFGLYVKISLIAAAVIASPWIVYQIWRFISAGLYPHERRVAFILAPFSTIMTILAVLFTYHILLPITLVFFIGFNLRAPEIEPSQPGPIIGWLANQAAMESAGMSEGDEAAAPPLARLPVLEADPDQPLEGQVWINRVNGRMKAHFAGRTHTVSVVSPRLINPLPDIGEYIHFAALIGLGVVIAFQLPLVMLVVGWTGLIDPDQIARFRKYAFFACFVVGALLTPVDLLSMFALALPLYGMFEFGLVLMRIADRHARQRLIDEEHP